METALIGWQLCVSTRLSNLQFQLERRGIPFSKLSLQIACRKYLEISFSYKKDIESFFSFFHFFHTLKILYNLMDMQSRLNNDE